MRLIHGISYVGFIVRAIITGSATVIARLFRSDYAEPMIVELPMRCATDLEVTLFASSAQRRPGALPLYAAARRRSMRSRAIAAGTSTTPPVIFVHALFEESEESALGGLIDMESRLLSMTRGRAPGPHADPQGGRS